MSGIKFRPAQSFASGDDDFALDVSDDGQVFTLTFSDIQAVADPSESPAPVAARLFSLVLPVDGGSNGLDISFAVSGYAFTTEGARGYSVLSVNGQTSVEQFPPGTDGEFVQELKFEAGPTCECGLAVSAIAERDAAYPDAVANLTVSSVDAQINRRRMGKFVLKQGSTGNYHFNLVASNGEVIATSESYESKASALKGVESVKRNAPDAPVDDDAGG
jgi:uncharacterized protein YegP (UPF0339 family)